MAIARVSYPADPPVAGADWTASLALVYAAFLYMQHPVPVVSGNIVKGAMFNIGGTVYQATSNTAITGTPSAYVKITPAGSSASAAYVANLSGVSWNDTYSGYYDGSWNLFIFDEAKAIVAGALSVPYRDRIVRRDEDGVFLVSDKGYMNLSFSTLGTGKPDISGIVEVDGAFVTLPATTPSGSPASPSNNWVYVSAAGLVSFDAANAPAWSTSKGGWYYGNLRAVAWVRVDSGGLYRYHHFLPLEQQASIEFDEVLAVGQWDMQLTESIQISHYLLESSIRTIDVRILRDDGMMISLLSATADYASFNGSFVSVGGIISMTRSGAGVFFSVDYNDAMNRGWITLKHKVL